MSEAKMGHHLSSAPKALAPPTDNINWNRIRIELQASDADSLLLQQWIDRAARRIVRLRLCMCVHCLVQYCDGLSELGAALVASVQWHSGVPSLLRSHRSDDD